MNPILQKITELHAQGLHVSAVGADRRGSGEWLVWIDLANMLPLGEAGDAPEHAVCVNLENLPQGVSARGWERHPREEMTVQASEEGIEHLMREVCREGRAVEMARFDGPAEHGYPHFLTKPEAWRK